MNEQERAERDAEWAASDKALNDTANVINVSEFRQGFHLGWQAACAAGAERIEDLERKLAEADFNFGGRSATKDSLTKQLAEREQALMDEYDDSLCQIARAIAPDLGQASGAINMHSIIRALSEREAAWQALVARVRQSLFYLPACHERDKVFDVLRSGPQPIPEVHK